MPKTGRLSSPLPSPMGHMAVKSEPRCNICKSASRSHVDRLVVSGFSYVDIAEDLIFRDSDFADKNNDTVRKNVERHAKLHVNVKEKATREIIERRALEQGMLLDDATGQITTGRALLDLIIARGIEQIADPDARIKYADAIEAVRMLEDTQKTEYLAQVESMQKQVWAIAQAVKEIVPEQYIPAVVNRAEDLYKNPTMELGRG